MNAAIALRTRGFASAWLGRAPRWSLAAGGLALALVWWGKAFYSHASAEDLRPLLAPTAGLVSWVTGGQFVYEQGAGWLSREYTFLIAPVCAGMNFALAAFLALVAGALPSFASARAVLARLAIYAGVAYVATVLVNAARISLAIALHQGVIQLDGLSAGEVHRAEGIAVYLVGLCALFAAAQRVEQAVARRGRAGGRAVAA